MIYIFSPTAQRAIQHVRHHLEPEFERHLHRNEYRILTPLSAARLDGVQFHKEDIVVELAGWREGSFNEAAELMESYTRRMARASHDRDVPQIRWR